MGGGILYLNRTKNHYFGHPITDEEFDGIRQFLKGQSYIEDVVDWKDQEINIDLDLFREMELIQTLLSQSVSDRFNVKFDLSKPWIEGIKKDYKADIIISRTPRYHSPFPWGELNLWKDVSAFVGSEEEHKTFIKETGIDIRHIVTKSWDELAMVIKGSKLFVGNQSFAYSLAEGMKHPRVLEVCHYCPNCDPQGNNGQVWLNQNIIRQFMNGKFLEEDVRRARHPKHMILVTSRKKKNEGYSNVSCVLTGNGPLLSKVDILREEGIEVILEDGGSFEEMANRGIEKTNRRIVCIADTFSCPNESVIASVIGGINQTKAGMVGTHTSLIGIPHASGYCFAVTREAYAKAGLFNSSLCPGIENFIEMNVRYRNVGIVCRSLGIQGSLCRIVSVDDSAKNRIYLEKHMGILI
jgi:hypothetical protein